MARSINRLSARTVATAVRPGYYPDGGGLYLQVSAAGTRSWIYRFKRNGQTRDMGLGSASVFSLLEARQKAEECRKLRASGLDPIEERRRLKPAVQAHSWGDCVDQFIESHRVAWKRDAQAEQWEQSLRDYGPARSLPVADIDTEIVLEKLLAIWSTKTETATRVRGRIERVLDWAKVKGFREGENPARWKGHLDKLLPRAAKVKRVTHFAAMPYTQVPDFVVLLRKRAADSANALLFTILTAARTGEVTGASWPEFHDDVWIVPAERMKAGVEHVVPLSTAAIEILEDRSRKVPPFALSENGMMNLLRKRMGFKFTVHGFRSSFRDWASETTTFPDSVVEMALAHTIGDETEAAYRRGNLLAKRRALMNEWANYVFGRPVSPQWAASIEG